LPLKFIPDNYGLHKDVITLFTDNSDTTLRIGRQFLVKANATENYGVNDRKEIDVLAMPNPVTEKLYLQFEKPVSGAIEIFDLLGKSFLKMQFLSQNEITFDLQDFDSGIYLVYINTAINSQKVIKIFKY
jgi:hypothetical protein